jgi:apolipoprotein N-acyltransferase
MPQPRTLSRENLAALAVAAVTAFLYIIAFPFAFWGGGIHSVPEAGYIFLAPVAFWLARPRKLSTTIYTVGGAFWFGWTVLMFWLRHVTFAGTVGLAGVLALFTVLWALAARKALPWIENRKTGERLAILAGLAGLWVLLEWVRSWFFGGFPWLPVAASQWARPAMLQILPWTGYLGLSWVLVFFNLSFASYALSFRKKEKDGALTFVKPTPEIYIALALVIACLGLFLSTLGHRTDEDLFYAGIVQPYEPGSLKWDRKRAQDNLARLARLSDDVSREGAQVVFWPESATPWPVMAPEGTMRAWADQMSSMIALPIVMGNMAEIPDPKGGDSTYYNGVFVEDPVKGLSNDFYAKRKLVPFGESNPLAFITDHLRFIDVPFGYFTPGKEAKVLVFKVPGGDTFRFGSLLCYEDIFPGLAAGEVEGGADFLFVATNNAWYGEEAGAYQHAAHSILRAVENRRPVLRCGNGGWSGMIDEYGVVRHLCERGDQGVYFMGGEVVPVVRTKEFKGTFTLYTRAGDWFAGVAAMLSLGLSAMIFLHPAKEPEQPVPAKPESEEDEDVPGDVHAKKSELHRPGKSVEATPGAAKPSDAGAEGTGVKPQDAKAPKKNTPSEPKSDGKHPAK